MWSATEEEFAALTGGARQYGHEHEAEGVAKFWERYPEYVIREGGFHEWTFNGVVYGSSPDRRLDGEFEIAGLEIKSPTGDETFEDHDLHKHWDQCQHGILVTKWHHWHLFVHHGKKSREWLVGADYDWQHKYLTNSKRFWDFCYADQKPKMRRLSIMDMPNG